MTRDGGKNWQNVTPPGMPEWIQINSIDASSFDAGTAYVAATMYKLDDFKPYLYKTSDYGKTWKKITNGIPGQRVHSRDPRRPKPTRLAVTPEPRPGLYVSFDDGENWQSLQLNLPVVPITDLAIHKREKDLVAATQGRAFWVLDDLPVLHQMAEAAKADAYLVQARRHLSNGRRGGGGGGGGQAAPLGQNPPGGAVIYYYLEEQACEAK